MIRRNSEQIKVTAIASAANYISIYMPYDMQGSKLWEDLAALTWLDGYKRALLDMQETKNVAPTQT